MLISFPREESPNPSCLEGIRLDDWSEEHMGPGREAGRLPFPLPPTLHPMSPCSFCDSSSPFCWEVRGRCLVHKLEEEVWGPSYTSVSAPGTSSRHLLLPVAETFWGSVVQNTVSSWHFTDGLSLGFFSLLTVTTCHQLSMFTCLPLFMSINLNISCLPSQSSLSRYSIFVVALLLF